MTLAQAVLASYEKPESDGYHIGQLTVTGISPCAYGTYLNYKKLDTQKSSATSQLNMLDGKWQEMEVVEELRHAGFFMRNTGADQLVLHVGKAAIAGRPDGVITVKGREDGLSIKAMNMRRYAAFSTQGLAAEPFIKCQEQLYLAAEVREWRTPIYGTWIYAKHKDSGRPFDLFEEKDETYSRPIIQATDEIILGGFEPKPLKTILCEGCRHNSFCWGARGTDTIDMTKIKTADMPEVVEKWKKGKFYKDYGDILVEEAREKLIGAMTPDEDLLFVEDLKVSKVTFDKETFSKTKFGELFGFDKLALVMDTTAVVQHRIRDMSD